MMGSYGFLDRAPLGRDEGDPAQMRIYSHDEYHDANAMSQQPESGWSCAAAHDHPDHPFGCGASGSAADR